MAVKELLIKLGVEQSENEAGEQGKRLNELTTKVKEAYQRVRQYFDEVIKDDQQVNDSSKKHSEVRKDLATLMEYTALFDDKNSNSSGESEDCHIKKYYLTVGGENAISSRGALETLIGYFGQPQKQKEELYLDGPVLVGKLVFKELEFLQDELGHDKWNFGREGMVIMTGQLAFLKKENGLTHIAVYRPFEESVDDEASIQIFEYNIKDLGQFKGKINK
ncbi:hypothetical protein HYU07_04870 [Candidatus Woesearchaeota archaeon]|nr:hypothetical protein [Candidatus Woesearchaeota archaeon]